MTKAEEESELKKNDFLHLEIKSQPKTLTQENHLRKNLEIKNVSTMGSYDQNSETVVHYTIVQFDNNSFDIYFNTSHIDFIAPGSL